MVTRSLDLGSVGAFPITQISRAESALAPVPRTPHFTADQLLPS
jgi:hypothetical protein